MPNIFDIFGNTDKALKGLNERKQKNKEALKGNFGGKKKTTKKASTKPSKTRITTNTRLSNTKSKKTAKRK